MLALSISTNSRNGFTVSAYAGDGAALLAFDLKKEHTKNLAGFSIQCTTPDAGPYKSQKYWLKNRLNFEKGLTKNVKVDHSKFVTSDQAPFQMFRWVHFPSAGPGIYQYAVYTSYFKNGSSELGTRVHVSADLTHKSFPNVDLGFTRGYVSSQAYTDLFQNKPIMPKKKSMDFDTKQFIPQYEWLGSHARKLVFNFLKECQKDNSVSVDVFAYDFDEPDIIRSLCKMGQRVRVFQDDAKLHGPSSIEQKTIRALKKAGVILRTGHFTRFAHNKVMIQKKNGKAVKVLTGSANFSIRGLYIQANSILVFDSPQIADLYEQAFDTAFNNAKKFSSSNIGSKWFPIKNNGKSIFSFCFSPHKKPTFSLDLVSKAIKSAESSVLFAVMAASGGGDVMDDLKNIGEDQKILSLGTIQQKSQIKSFKQNDKNSAIASFGFLQSNLPTPFFKKEWSGGTGQVIHHKFVVCDFNGRVPAVFCGSSNLSSGGEENNGDNLIAIYEPDIVTCYAVEAIRLFDHYRFRSKHVQSTAKNPLKLQQTEDWAVPYYNPNDIRSLERRTFCPC